MPTTLPCRASCRRPRHPRVGRWLNQDPIGERGGLNLYAYVENGPENFVDLYGLAQRDVRKIIEWSKQLTDNLTQEGKRMSDGIVNNVVSSSEMARSKLNDTLGNHKKAKDIESKRKLGCGEQAASLYDYLKNREHRLIDDWKFFLVEATEATVPFPHQFLMGQSSDPSDPVLFLDPFNARFSTKPPPLWRIGHIEPLQ